MWTSALQHQPLLLLLSPHCFRSREWKSMESLGLSISTALQSHTTTPLTLYFSFNLRTPGWFYMIFWKYWGKEGNAQVKKGIWGKVRNVIERPRKWLRIPASNWRLNAVLGAGGRKETDLVILSQVLPKPLPVFISCPVTHLMPMLYFTRCKMQ